MDTIPHREELRVCRLDMHAQEDDDGSAAKRTTALVAAMQTLMDIECACGCAQSPSETVMHCRTQQQFLASLVCALCSALPAEDALST